MPLALALLAAKNCLLSSAQYSPRDSADTVAVAAEGGVSNMQIINIYIYMYIVVT